MSLLSLSCQICRNFDTGRFIGDQSSFNHSEPLKHWPIIDLLKGPVTESQPDLVIINQV